MSDADVFFADGDVSGATSGSHTRGLALHGELDLATVPILERAVAAYDCDADSDSARGFVLDLRAMTFVDLCGIRTLARTLEQVTRGASRVIVTPSTSPGVQRMISLAVLNGWLPGAFTFAPAVVLHSWAPSANSGLPGRL